MMFSEIRVKKDTNFGAMNGVRLLIPLNTQHLPASFFYCKRFSKSYGVLWCDSKKCGCYQVIKKSKFLTPFTVNGTAIISTVHSAPPSPSADNPSNSFYFQL